METQDAKPPVEKKDIVPEQVEITKKILTNILQDIEGFSPEKNIVVRTADTVNVVPEKHEDETYTLHRITTPGPYYLQIEMGNNSHHNRIMVNKIQSTLDYFLPDVYSSSTYGSTSAPSSFFADYNKNCSIKFSFEGCCQCAQKYSHLLELENVKILDEKYADYCKKSSNTTMGLNN